MTKVTGREFGTFLCNLYGIDLKFCSSVIIEADANDVAKIIFTISLDDEEMKNIKGYLEKCSFNEE